jgi:GNAT superfamily N-acetyltransferase
VAIVENIIVGVCYIDISFITLQTIRIGDMMISAPYRKNGIATALIKKIVEFAREHDVKKIWLWTQEELVSAIKCYEKNGFKLEGVQKAQFCGKNALVYGLVL